MIRAGSGVRALHGGLVRAGVQDELLLLPELEQGGGYTGSELRRPPRLGEPALLHHVGHPRELPEAQAEAAVGHGGMLPRPVWDGNEGWELAKRLPRVFRAMREWAKGTHLFTAADLRGHGRTAWRPTRDEAVLQHGGAGIRDLLHLLRLSGMFGGLEPLLPATDKTLCMYITHFCCHPTGGEEVLGEVLGEASPAGHAAHVSGLGQDGASHLHAQPRARGAVGGHLVGFFGLFRNDNLTTGKRGAWNTRGALVSEDVLFQEDGSVDQSAPQ
ncbi:hypothetical protein CYMTET_24559 [Cymbomonas tetramitiformis]|uniref:Uncharacterized protein n=1 Tax=Cymbomonas tetramitiformis TaxID=36881 RepID=A0AAE0L043_9CHLO|nr:hypothetical protein CYMTET_24559 [Cymbomonas tetramitiformis]